jgi:pyridoxamine 5'-phosphate oxidase
MNLDDLGPDPLAQLEAWIAEAESAGVELATAFALATAAADGAPSVRMVLARGLDERGVAFYTNRLSRKGRDLAANPRAAATFHWASLGRQVRLAGPVLEIGTEESAAYFASRPPPSRISAWASAQGEPIEDRAALEARAAAAAARFAGDDVPLPPFWGGYRLLPEVAEFWASRADRLHDRIEFRRLPVGWDRRRLQP